MAIPSLSLLEKLADRPVDALLPPRFNEAARKFLVTFLTQLANRSACVDIYINAHKKLASMWYHNVRTDTSISDSSR